MENRIVCSSPVGNLQAVCRDGALTELSFTDKPVGGDENGLTACVRQQLEEYFNGSRTAFDIPLAPEGTLFQKAVWQALCTIPYGETRTYSQIAAAIGNPKACRAIGMANHRNPIVILIPCHRVIGADGTLTGYAGGSNIKKHLLELEQKHNKERNSL